jgi:flagellar hook protein FlgE
MALLGTLTSGVSALKTFSKSLDVIGNNIANVNTTAYKSSSVNFSDTFSNTLRAASSNDSALQIGTGVQVAGVNTNFKQGSMNSTGSTTDLAVSGKGYFVVQSGTMKYATRDGAFHFDTSGKLLNSQNMAVLGVDGNPIVYAGYSTAASVSIASDGSITAFDSSGTATAAGQVGLLNISDEAKLMKVGGNLYDFGAAVTGPVTTLSAPSAAGMGKIMSGELELSNVDLTEQFSDLITSQRSFQAASRLITVSDSVGCG